MYILKSVDNYKLGGRMDFVIIHFPDPDLILTLNSSTWKTKMHEKESTCINRNAQLFNIRIHLIGDELDI